VINVFSKTISERYWYVYNGEVEIDGPFPTKEAAYAAARVHGRRQQARIKELDELDNGPECTEASEDCEPGPK
jgi:hypothetical protein